MAVGNGSLDHPKSYLEFGPEGMKEVEMPAAPGLLSSIWGLDDQHVYATADPTPFIHYRRHGQWTSLTLPEGTTGIHDGCALSPEEVYFVGNAQVHLFDGRQVTRLTVPESGLLQGIGRLDAHRVCIFGNYGTLLVGGREGFRAVPTGTTDRILGAAVGGKIYFGASGRVWVTDADSAPAVLFDFPVRWLAGLDDGFVVSGGGGAQVYADGRRTELDVSVTL